MSGGDGQRGQQHRQPGSWDCAKCKGSNFPNNTSCFRCKQPKPISGQQQQKKEKGFQQQDFPSLSPGAPPQNVWGQQPQDSWRQSASTSGSFPQKLQKGSPQKQPAKIDAKREQKQKPMAQDRSVVQGTSPQLTPVASSAVANVTGKFQDVMGNVNVTPTKFSVLSDKNGLKFEGSKGTKSHVQVNFLPIILNANLPDTAYHYDVTFNPERPKKFYQAALDKVFAGKSSFAFDGKKNIYTAKPLAAEEIEETVEVLDPMRDSTKSFKVTVKFATKVDMQALKK